MDVRRVVTGHDASGKSVFVSDETVAPVIPMMLPEFQAHLLWGGDKTPQFPDDGTMPEWHTYFPPIGGFRFGLFTVAPETTAAPDTPDMEAAVADAEAKLPGLLGYMDPSDPGMHTTDTIDFEVVLEGTIVLELDDGAEVTLNPETPWCRTAPGIAGGTRVTSPHASRCSSAARRTTACHLCSCASSCSPVRARLSTESHRRRDRLTSSAPWPSATVAST